MRAVELLAGRKVRDPSWRARDPRGAGAGATAALDSGEPAGQGHSVDQPCQRTEDTGELAMPTDIPHGIKLYGRNAAKSEDRGCALLRGN